MDQAKMLSLIVVTLESNDHDDIILWYDRYLFWFEKVTGANPAMIGNGHNSLIVTPSLFDEHYNLYGHNGSKQSHR